MKPTTADNKTFITGVAQDAKAFSIGVSYKDVPKAKEITENYMGLVAIIDEFNEKIASVIQYHEKDFFAAFKTRMYQIKEEMKILKEKASKDRLEMKREERMASLQSERDWFRKEALELDKMVKDKSKVISQMKNRLENAEEDREWFHDQLMQTK